MRTWSWCSLLQPHHAEPGHEVVLHLSYADLTDADLTRAALAGARWDGRTEWPAGTAELMRERSDVLSDGSFQVRRGAGNDRSEAGVPVS
jgi:hypothetical protein